MGKFEDNRLVVTAGKLEKAGVNLVPMETREKGRAYR
jgi:hypothetical protein